MNEYYDALVIREHFRKMAALDRQLAHWGRFQRNAKESHARAWRVRIGQGLVRLGIRLQGESALPTIASKDA